MILVNLYGRAVENHIFKKEEINLAFLLDRRNHDRDFQADSERRHASQLGISEFDQRIRLRIIRGFPELHDCRLDFVTANFFGRPSKIVLSGQCRIQTEQQD